MASLRYAKSTLAVRSQSPGRWKTSTIWCALNACARVSTDQHLLLRGEPEQTRKESPNALSPP